jgi:hypothetical protein
MARLMYSVIASLDGYAADKDGKFDWAAPGGDLSVGGPTLAGAMLPEGLVDELHLLAAPVVVGGGTHWLPEGLRIDLDLLDQHRFRGGAVHLHYRVRR